MTMWRIRFACSITKAAGMHSDYVILVASAARQKWLRARFPLRPHWLWAPLRQRAEHEQP